MGLVSCSYVESVGVSAPSSRHVFPARVFVCVCVHPLQQIRLLPAQVVYQSGWRLPYVPFVGLGVDARRGKDFRFASSSTSEYSCGFFA